MTRSLAMALFGLLSTGTLLFCSSARAADPAPADKKPSEAAEKENREALEKKFAETMSGVVLTGHYTMGEMKKADSMLAELYRKAGSPERYHCSYYPGIHKFDAAMQSEAFAWFDKWLKK